MSSHDAPSDFIKVDYPFHELTAETVTDLAEISIDRANLLAQMVIGAATHPTYENTVGALDEIRDLGGYEGDYGRLPMLVAAVDTHEDVRTAADTAQTEIQDYFTGLFSMPELYTSVEAYKRRIDSTVGATQPESLSPERTRLLDTTLAEFEYNGQGLSPEDSAKVQVLLKTVNENSNTFRRNISNDRAPLTFTREQLAGLSESFVSSLDTPGGGGDELGHIVTTKHYEMMMQRASDRAVREAVWRAKNSVAKDLNLPILVDTVQKRQQIATTLGYKSWADLQLKDTMAGSLEAVEAFYDSIKEPLQQKVARELAPMQELLAADGFAGPVQAWDTKYYAEKIRQRDYNIAAEKIAEYFPLDGVLEGLFKVTGDMYGLTYERLDTTNVWHEDVQYYGIRDRETGEPLGTFYLDLFPRPGKIPAQGVTYTLQSGNKLPTGEQQQSSAVLIINLLEPTADTPSLLQPKDVRDLFHEMGHVVHLTTGRTESDRFAGTNVPKDFLEAPSQVMEYLPFSEGVLQMIGKHYQTGEQIPAQTITDLIAAQNVTIGLDTIRNLQLGIFDLGIHDRSESKDLDYVHKIYEKATKFSGTPLVEGTFWPGCFAHPFDGYDALYHAYTWAKVYGDDILSYFKQAGLLNAGRDFRAKVLAPGGSISPAETLPAFLGRPTNNRAFFQRLDQ